MKIFRHYHFHIVINVKDESHDLSAHFNEVARINESDSMVMLFRQWANEKLHATHKAFNDLYNLTDPVGKISASHVIADPNPVSEEQAIQLEKRFGVTPLLFD